MTPTNDQINAYLSKETGLCGCTLWKKKGICKEGMWDIFTEDKSYTENGFNCKGCREYKVAGEPHPYLNRVPLDFFTPDGMVALLVWWKELNGELDEINLGQRCRQLWGCVFARYDEDGERTGYGYAQADTPMAAVAHAAYEALGGGE